MVEYANVRVRLDSIVNYWPVYKNESSGDRHGILIDKRDGDTLNIFGDDMVSRDQFVLFLDNHFKVKSFNTNKCTVCANKTKGCSSEFNCRGYNGWPKFARLKESTDVSKTA
jgi:hypothetical protein